MQFFPAYVIILSIGKAGEQLYEVHWLDGNRKECCLPCLHKIDAPSVGLASGKFCTSGFPGVHFFFGKDHEMEIMELTKHWLPAAAELVRENYREERAALPVLPEGAAVPSLTSLAENGLGVVAVEGDRLLGFLGAYGPWEPVFYTASLRGVFSPLHAHGAVKEGRGKLYQRMYQAAAENWVRAGAASHAITIFAHDFQAREALYCYGFGLRCIDLMRETDLKTVTGRKAVFRELPPREHAKLRPLRRALSQHLAHSPSFMLDTQEEIESWIKRREENPPRVFAAEVDGQLAAYMEFKEEGENFVASTPGTRNICGAFCLPQYRGTGIARQLLDHMTSILHREGYTHLGVDCESFNPTALGFWTKHFEIYTHSVVRRIDDNAVHM